MKFKKIIWVIGVLILFGCVDTYATGEGIYLGVQGGKTNTHNVSRTLQSYPVTLTEVIPGVPLLAYYATPSTVTINPSNTGVGGRLFFGYNFNSYFALEMGFTHYAASTYDQGSSKPPRVANPTIIPGSIDTGSAPSLLIANPIGKPAIQENGFDFVGKGTFPIGNFGVFGKAGIAIIRTSLAGTLATTYSPVVTIKPFDLPPYSVDFNPVVATGTTNYIRPTAALGVSYDFNQNIVAELTASRVFAGGGFQAADLYSLGISYHFVDKYCGQFLC